MLKSEAVKKKTRRNNSIRKLKVVRGVRNEPHLASTDFISRSLPSGTVGDPRPQAGGRPKVSRCIAAWSAGYGDTAPGPGGGRR